MENRNIIIVLILLLAAGIGIYFYVQKQNLNKEKDILIKQIYAKYPNIDAPIEYFKKQSINYLQDVLAGRIK